MERALARAAQRIEIGGGYVIQLRQHLFETPVPQPRVGQRVADRSGLKLWPCAVPLLSHLQTVVIPTLSARLGAAPRVLELGSGTGLLGIGLAASTGASVVCTDPAIRTNFEDGEEGSTLDWLRANLALNADACSGRCSAEQLVWGDAAHVDAIRAAHPRGFDLVVGSDLLYDSAHYAALVATLLEFAPARSAMPSVVLGYPHRTHGEARFLDLAKAHFDVTQDPLEGLRQETFVANFTRREARV